MRQTWKVLIVIILTGCSVNHKFRKDRAAFESSSVLNKWVAISDMNDSYFEIRENNFFEFYRQLFDSIRNTSFPGKYTLSGDTMYLDFYDKKGKELIGSKALLNKKENKIYLFARP